MPSSVFAGTFTGNQLRMSEALGMNLTELSEEERSEPNLRAKQREEALRVKGIHQGSQVKCVTQRSRERHFYRVADLDFFQGVAVLRDTNGYNREVTIRPRISTLIRNFAPVTAGNGGKTW